MTSGGGFNAMAVAVRQGATVDYGGVLGKGLLAGVAARDLERLGVHCVSEGRPDIDQGVCVVLVDARGERTFVSHHGAERQFPSGWDRTHRPLLYKWILVSGYTLFHAASAAAMVRWFEALPAGPHAMFDPSPVIAGIDRRIADPILARCNWLSANATEAQVLTGLASPPAACKALASVRSGALVRVGADGCWLAHGGREPVHIPGFAVDVVDSNGAGDCHIGAFIAAMARGCQPEEAAMWANAAAAISVSRFGPSTSPTLEETRALMETAGPSEHPGTGTFVKATGSSTDPK
jgi:sugar/nucleoside kinase (ribokinase family)